MRALLAVDPAGQEFWSPVARCSGRCWFLLAGESTGCDDVSGFGRSGGFKSNLGSPVMAKVRQHKGSRRGHHFGKGAPAQGSRWGSLVLSEDYFKIDTYRISKPGLSGSVSCRDTVAEKETPPRFLCPGNRTRAGWLSSSRSNL